jgi:hypothetical protein
MGKKKGIDIIEEAHERADHNFHSTYWFNRVTSFTVAQWNVNKILFPRVFVAFTLLGLLGIFSLNQIALEQNKTFWSYLFDFSDSATTSRFTGILIFSAIWVIAQLDLDHHRSYSRVHPHFYTGPRSGVLAKPLIKGRV